VSDHTPSPWTLLLAEITAAGVGGHAIESLSHLPGWVGGLFGGLVMGITLRLLDPLLRVHGETIARRLIPVPVLVSAPRSRSVLVVDDHEGCRHLLAEMLREALGLPVYEARSGAEARGLMARHHCGAVLCDLILPDELGGDVLAAIGRKGDVLMSGVAEADALDAAAHRVGAVAMRKPIDRARIVDHLTAALGATS
jgi:CheY-like chemotaxis protein